MHLEGVQDGTVAGAAAQVPRQSLLYILLGGGFRLGAQQAVHAHDEACSAALLRSAAMPPDICHATALVCALEPGYGSPQAGTWCAEAALRAVRPRQTLLHGVQPRPPAANACRTASNGVKPTALLPVQEVQLAVGVGRDTAGRMQ